MKPLWQGRSAVSLPTERRLPSAPPERLAWTPELVSRFWDGVAHTALDAQSFARIAGPLVILAARSHFRPGGRHLDFGAGDGTLTRLMIEAGFPTAAYEPAPERRAVLDRQLAGLAGFLGADAEAHAPYDAVLMAEVIEHVLDQDLDAVLSTIHAFLKPGGRLVITTPHDEDLDASMVYCPVSNMLFHRWQHVRSWSGESVTAFLRDRGFGGTRALTTDFDVTLHIRGKHHPLRGRWWSALRKMLRYRLQPQRKRPHLVVITQPPARG